MKRSVKTFFSQKIISENTNYDSDYEINVPEHKIESNRKKNNFSAALRQKYNDIRKLYLTSKNDTGRRPFKCQLENCDKSFSDSSNLKRHMKRVHSEGGEEKCDEPKSSAEKICVLKQNKINQAGIKRINSIDPGNKQFEPNSDPEKITSKNSIEETIECTKSNSSSQPIFYNKVLVNKPYKCTEPNCNSAYTRRANLHVHRRIHTGVNLFKCDHPKCEKVFTTNGDLRQHMRIHTGEKPFKCLVCNVAFTQISILQQHKLIHTGEKPYKCDFPNCGVAFIQSSNLRVHKRTHTGEKPFKCDYPNCDKYFINSSNLKVHKRIHNGEKPFKCSEPGCESAFSQSFGLKQHKLVHTGEKPFKCDVSGCQRSFINSSNLKVHKRIHSEKLWKSKQKQAKSKSNNT